MSSAHRFSSGDVAEETWRTVESGPAPDAAPANVDLYALRHSGISHLLLAGVPVAVVAQIADNSETVIRRHYVHIAEELLRPAVDRADAVLTAVLTRGLAEVETVGSEDPVVAAEILPFERNRSTGST